MGGYIMQLQNFSVNDGDGIRTNIFLAGCPLRCAWCANPEGQTSQNPMTHFASTEEILKEIRRQYIFYRNSGGGVTFSGGEPTAQPEFLKELTDTLYDEGVSLAIETCGQFDFEQLRPVLKKMDLVFMDLKHIDAKKHEAFTGLDNKQILSNMCKTYELDVPMVIRIPLIKGVNCEEAAVRPALEFIKENLPKAGLEFLPYHKYGEEKYTQLEMPMPASTFDTPSEAELAKWKKLAEAYGIRVVSYR